MNIKESIDLFGLWIRWLDSKPTVTKGIKFKEYKSEVMSSRQRPLGVWPWEAPFYFKVVPIVGISGSSGSDSLGGIVSSSTTTYDLGKVKQAKIRIGKAQVFLNHRLYSTFILCLFLGVVIGALVSIIPYFIFGFSLWAEVPIGVIVVGFSILLAYCEAVPDIAESKLKKLIKHRAKEVLREGTNDKTFGFSSDYERNRIESEREREAKEFFRETGLQTDDILDLVSGPGGHWEMVEEANWPNFIFSLKR